MYCPAHFEETRPAVLRELMARHPLATLVRTTAQGLVADHIPLLHQDDASPWGRLIGHVARANPLWRTPGEEEVLLVFQGPDSYVSPNWYASKAETGKVVPTWNYAVVHAYGRLTPVEDAGRIRTILTMLTDTHEAAQPHPWRVADAPAEYTERLIANVVGLEIVISRMSGKWKVSQNHPDVNRQGVVQGLRDVGSDDARAMADLIARRMHES